MILNLNINNQSIDKITFGEKIEIFKMSQTNCEFQYYVKWLFGAIKWIHKHTQTQFDRINSIKLCVNDGFWAKRNEWRKSQCWSLVLETWDFTHPPIRTIVGKHLHCRSMTHTQSRHAFWNLSTRFQILLYVQVMVVARNERGFIINIPILTTL